MSSDFILRTAEKAMEAGINECSSDFEQSSKRALGLITEAAEIIKSHFPNSPYMIGEVLGQWLITAVDKDRPDAVILLKELGACPDCRTKNGLTPLQKLATAESDHEDMIRTLMGFGGADPELPIVAPHACAGQNALIAAVTSGRTANVETLLEMGANPDAQVDGGLFETALHVVAKRFDGAKGMELAKALVKGGANPLCCDSQGCMAIHRAIQSPVQSKGNERSDPLPLYLLSTAEYPQNVLNGLLLMSLYNNKGWMIDPLMEAGADVRVQFEGKSLVELATGYANEALLRRVTSLIMQADLEAAMPDEKGNPNDKVPQTSGMPSPL